MLDKVDSVLCVLQMNVFDRQYETLTSRKYCHMLKNKLDAVSLLCAQVF